MSGRARHCIVSRGNRQCASSLLEWVRSQAAATFAIIRGVRRSLYTFAGANEWRARVVPTSLLRG